MTYQPVRNVCQIIQYLFPYYSPNLNPRFFIGILSAQKTFKHEVWARSRCSASVSAQAGNDGGTSTWLVSMQFQNSAKGRKGSKGSKAAEDTPPLLCQVGTLMLKGVVSFSCDASKLVSWKA